MVTLAHFSRQALAPRIASLAIEMRVETRELLLSSYARGLLLDVWTGI